MKLNEEGLSYPESVRLLEQMLATQEIEIRELRYMREGALTVREKSKVFYFIKIGSRYGFRFIYC